MKNLSSLDITLLILAVALLVCLAPMPYGFYSLVRFVTAILMACVAYINYREERPVIATTAAATALLFQPFFKIALGRGMWNIVDVALAIVIVVYVFKKNDR